MKFICFTLRLNPANPAATVAINPVPGMVVEPYFVGQRESGTNIHMPSIRAIIEVTECFDEVMARLTS